MYTVKYDYDYSPFSSQSHLISHHMPLPKSIFILFYFFDNPVSPDIAAHMCMGIALSTAAW